jgi:hypothetical protein
LAERLSEADTRAYLVDPILRLLGYETVSDIRREVAVPATKEFLDYQLSVDGKPEIIVEAKALRHSITDQHAAQCVQYAAILGIRWCLITNGTTWALYDAYAKGPLAEKKVVEFSIGIEEPALVQAWSVLSMFSKESLARNDPLIGLLIDRVVYDDLSRAESGAISALQRTLRIRFGERVSGQEIVRRLRPRLLPFEVEAPDAKTTGHPISKGPVSRPAPQRGSGELQQLIDSGAIPPDATLEARVRGISHVAVIRDGRIELNGVLYASLSTAAASLREGQSSNGWKWWRYKGELLAAIRDRARVAGADLENADA